MKPLYENIIIRPDPETDTLDGFSLPDTSIQKPSTGTILSCGDAPMPFSVGDRVLFTAAMAYVYEQNEETLYIINYKYIIAIL